MKGEDKKWEVGEYRIREDEEDDRRKRRRIIKKKKFGLEQKRLLEFANRSNFK